MSVKEIVELLREMGFNVNEKAVAEDVEELEEFEREARELRCRSADWSYIERQPEPVRTALKVLVETGDFKLAAHIAGLKLDEFNEVRLAAKIPVVL